MHNRNETKAQRDTRLDREASLNFRARRYGRYANHLEDFKGNSVELGKPVVQATAAVAPAPSTGDVVGVLAPVAAV